MNLFTNANAEFTNWVVKAGLLREPFVLVDVGVQGGEDPSWHRLGDYLVVHGPFLAGAWGYLEFACPVNRRSLSPI